MAQPIQSYMGHAADALQQANLQSGNAGMNSPVPAVMNAMDSGRYTKEGLNPQTEIVQQQETGNLQQNIGTAATGASANAERLVDNEVLKVSQQEYDAQAKLAEHHSQMLFASGMYQGVANMANPEVAARAKRDTALQTLQRMGVNTFDIPDIG
jgi:hypothetical protein